MLQRAFEQRPSVSKTETFPAPAKGWVQSGNIVFAGRDQAEVLDNFICTAQGIRLRGGMTQYADLFDPAVRLFTYSSTEDTLFSSTADRIYGVDRLSVTNPLANTPIYLTDVDGNYVTDIWGNQIITGYVETYGEVEGLGAGDWSTVQLSNTAGEFMVMVNGTDYAMYYDGADFEPITSVAVNDVSFDAQTAAFTVGDTVTGSSSGATATILAITKTSATEGVLKVGTITGGPFTDDEGLTDASGGGATANGASASGSAVAITGVDTKSLNQVWSFKERLFFVEKNSLSAWYLPVESIGGAASELDLGAVFALGGNLLFGATWSLDSGSGIDDVCIFVTTNGEIAVYEGADPGSASTWSLAGVYKIGRPLNKHAWFAAGGDLAILTEDGIVPVSEALRKDRAALQAVALTYPIEDAWKDAIANRAVSYPISATLWQSKTLLLVGTPSKDGGKSVSFAANARTGAWSRITGWDVRCSAISGDQLYFADEEGVVYTADSGGTDNGIEYTAVCVPKFSYADSLRSVNAVGLTYTCTSEVNFNLQAHSGYTVDPIDIPSPIVTSAGTTWGTGVWGTFVWGSSATVATYNEWQAAYANGYSIAPSIAVTSNQSSKPTFEVLSMRVRTETGYPL